MNPREPAVDPPRPAYFRYCGSPSLAGVGSVTGAYTFSGAGSAVAVDPQDAALPRRCAAPGPNQLGTSNRKWHVVPRICGTGHMSACAKLSCFEDASTGRSAGATDVPVIAVSTRFMSVEFFRNQVSRAQIALSETAL